jgi:hypothetical protein
MNEVGRAWMVAFLGVCRGVFFFFCVLDGHGRGFLGK